MFCKNFRAFFCLALLASPLFGARVYRAMENEPVVPNRLLVRVRGGARSAAVLSRLAPGAKAYELGNTNLHVVEFSGKITDATLEQAGADPDISFVEPDRIRRATLAPPNDPKFASQWALNAVQALGAWGMLPARYLNGAIPAAQRIRIAVLDSGVDCTHPDFRNPGGTSTDSEQGGQLLFRSSKAFLQTTLTSAACSWQDDYGHGTHVTGTIAAVANNQVGVAGLAYPAQILTFKVLDATGHGPDSVIARAIIAAADAGAAVISMSLGETGYSQSLQDAVDYAWQHNSLVVAAAGNNNDSELFFPASGNHVISVAATNSTGARASFSNFGDFIDVAAPGLGILSTVPTYPLKVGVRDYGIYSGTSMATPHVSAAAGLIAMTTPGLLADAIAQRIQQSADAPSLEWNPYFGYGSLNVANALGGRLRPGTMGGMSGQVLDASGDPVAGAQIAANGMLVASTAGSGLFRVWNEPAGVYTVRVSAPGYAAQQMTVVIPPGADAPLTVRMGVPMATLAGTVMSEGTPLAGAVVAAVSNGLIEATAVTDSVGRYWLPVVPGTYQVRASAVSYEPVSIPPQPVTAGATTSRDITLARMGWISGMLTDGTGKAVANADIYVAGDRASAGTRTDASGGFSTLGLPAGTYSVTATAGAASSRLDDIWVISDYGAAVTLQFGGNSHQQAPASSSKPFTPIRINAGGPAIVDANGTAWSADSGFAGGMVFSTSAQARSNAAPQVYQSERWGQFLYRFSVPDGLYTVKLKFAEILFTHPGQRVFGMTINGAPVLSDFDIFAEAGGRYIGIDRQFTVAVTRGYIDIQSIPQIQNPKISAIEIVGRQ